ncbi:Hsp20/alpha crystallin family protein [Saccharopolyspora pogona]|uniref:Hsp20/alpha crystallin family protein n=1 Tax=Saccharopolyspora pogona TaxID=333966 RepID=UPI001CC25E6B|nr:Hsp20/alpha crystallin family protein [Saccharopolyspora pogona]
MAERMPARRGERREWAGPPDMWQEPFRELEEIWDRMGQLFDPGWATTRTGVAWQPMVDVEETENAYVFEFDLPGVRRDDITVEVRGQELWIMGEVKEKERTGVLRRKMRRTGSFSFRGALPGEVDADKIEANLADGVLSVKVPKAEVSKSRRIEIK